MKNDRGYRGGNLIILGVDQGPCIKFLNRSYSANT